MSKSIVLCYSPGACSLAPHIVLYELGVPFTARRFATAERANYGAEFLAINPKARIPALIIDGFTLTENPAILTYLGRRFPEAKLYPANTGEAEARCLEWLAWLSNTVHIAVAQVFRPVRYVKDEKDHPPVVESGKEHVRQSLAQIERHLAKNPFAVGSSLTVVDPCLLPYYRWGNRMKFDMRADYPSYTRFVEKLGDRPAVKKALEVEGIGLLG